MTESSIVLIEDSEPYIAELLALLEDKLQIQKERVRIIRTEVEFFDAMPGIEEDPPAVFIVDVMVPYQAVGELDTNVPPEVREIALKDRFYRAGVRCTNFLLNNSKLRTIPIILHSILEKADMESDKSYPIPVDGNLTICKKEANGHGIIQAAERILKHNS